MTSVSGTTLNAEANLTMSGNVLQFNTTANTHGMRFVAAGNHYNTLSFDSNITSAGDTLSILDRYIQEAEITLDKSKIQNIIRDTYQEACEMV